MRHYTTRVKQTFKKQPVLECRLRFSNGNSVLQRFSRSSLRNSKWLEGRIRKLASIGASGETVLAAYASGVRVVTRQGKARRQMARSIAPVRRQTVAAPVVARACVREGASEGHDGGGGSSDDGGAEGSDPEPPQSRSLNGDQERRGGARA